MLKRKERKYLDKEEKKSVVESPPLAPAYQLSQMLCIQMVKHYIAAVTCFSWYAVEQSACDFCHTQACFAISRLLCG